MQPINKPDNQEPAKSFIEQARQKQIIEATIKVLAEYGYVNTSFVRIAKQAGISPGLISYHFKDKKELTVKILETIAYERVTYVTERVSDLPTATAKLQTALEADMANMGTQPERYTAMVEALFGMRGVKGSLEFLGQTEDPALTVIKDILKLGQKNGEFGRFDVENTAMIIDGARDTFLAQVAIRRDLNLETFTKTLIDFSLQAVKK